jgi:hypothetical protein
LNPGASSPFQQVSCKTWLWSLRLQTDRSAWFNAAFTASSHPQASPK